MNTAEEILSLKAEIEEYKSDLRAATTKEEKSELRQLITACTNRLTALETIFTASTAGNLCIMCFFRTYF